MQFTSALASLAILSTAFAATTSDAQVLKDINKLKADTSAFDADINALTPSATFIQILALLGPAGTILSDIKTTTNDVNAVGKFNTTGSNDVAASFLSFIPVVAKTLNDLDAKQPIIEKNSLGLGDPIVANQLEQQRSAAASLAKALQNSLDATFSGLVPTFAAQVDADFVKAINTYGGNASPSS